MFPPKKYIKKATKQGVITTILLGVIPFSFALGLDIFAVVNNQGHELINFNNMISSLCLNYWFSSVRCSVCFKLSRF